MFHFFFFLKYTATTEIYTLSLHDALPISAQEGCPFLQRRRQQRQVPPRVSRRVRFRLDPRHAEPSGPAAPVSRSEEHTSELQSRQYLVCRLLLEKKKKHNM